MNRKKITKRFRVRIRREATNRDFKRALAMLDKIFEIGEPGAISAAVEVLDRVAAAVVKTQIVRLDEFHAPRPSRKAEQWLKRQLKTLTIPG